MFYTLKSNHLHLSRLFLKLDECLYNQQVMQYPARQKWRVLHLVWQNWFFSHYGKIIPPSLQARGRRRAKRENNFSLLWENKNLIPAGQSRYTFLFVSLSLTLRHLREIMKRCTSLSLSLPLKEEFSLYKKLWDSLD